VTGFGILLAMAMLGLAPLSAGAQAKTERARELGIPLDGSPGPLDAITDVAGVAVGIPRW
jgi:D-aminopeptidase